MAAPWEDLLRVALRNIGDARERLASPRVRFEMRRKAFHVGGAIVAVPVLLLLTFWWAVAFGVSIVAVVVVAFYVRERRFGVAGGLDAVPNPVADAIEMTRRPGERFPWAPVSFTLALIAVGVAVELASLPQTYAFAAYGILGVGDAASALIGVAYGAHKLPWSPRKSWEGLAAGAVAGFLAATLFGAVGYAATRELLPPELVGVFALGALVGALLETLPGEDNVTVPVGSLLVMVGAGTALGLV